MAHRAPLTRAGLAGALLLAACAPVRAPLGSSRAVEAALESATTSPIAADRAVAFDALGAAGLADRLDRIRAGAEDADPLVRAAVLRARMRLEPAAIAPTLRRLASSANADEQRWALAAVDAGVPTELATEIVDAAARSDHAEVRRAALDRIVGLPLAARRRVVALVLDDSDETVRLAGVRASFSTRQADPLPRLLNELMLGPAERRAQAARLLGEVGEVSAIPALFHAAGETGGLVGPSARASLCRLGVATECGRLRAFVVSRNLAEAGPAIAALAAIGDAPAREALAAAVAHPEVEIRREAARVISALNTDGLANLLLPLLDDERAEIRALAAAALIEVEPVRALAAVEGAITGSNPALRDHLASVLVARYDRRASENCATGLRMLARIHRGMEGEPVWASELPTVSAALRALLHHGDQETRGLAADAALRHPAPELRFQAAHAVAEGAVDDPGQALVEALEDPVPAVRIVAAAARLRLTRSGMITPDE